MDDRDQKDGSSVAEPAASDPVRLPVGQMGAVVFDMDGVVTDTAGIHARAWKSVFDPFLRVRAEQVGEPFRPFTARDYLEHVDGLPRYDGVARFLESRHLSLPRGVESDAPGHGTVCALGNLKDLEFERALRRRGVTLFPSTVALLRSLRATGVRTAVISSSRHLHAVLQLAGESGLFDASVDGVEAERLGLPGKPDPAIFLEAARRLGVGPERTVVVEDALAGVEAGRRGGFLLVVGVDRTGRPDRARQLHEHGADVVVDDLGAVVLPSGDPTGPAGDPR